MRKLKKRPHILITNDDGIHAPGISFLWEAIRDMADITIVAPAVEQSASGLSITVRQPLRLEKVDRFENTEAWSVAGTPADCVKMALSVLLKNPPDLVVAGINRGSNAGRNVLYSGTVASIIEGVMHDIPGVAFSSCDYPNPDYSAAHPYIPLILKHALDHPLPHGTLLNVNFPMRHLGINGVKMTRQGKEYFTENPDKRSHPAEGHDYYWLGIKVASYEEFEDCDITWLKKGYVTAVPVHVSELTDHAQLAQRKTTFESLFLN